MLKHCISQGLNVILLPVKHNLIHWCNVPIRPQVVQAVSVGPLEDWASCAHYALVPTVTPFFSPLSMFRRTVMSYGVCWSPHFSDLYGFLSYGLEHVTAFTQNHRCGTVPEQVDRTNFELAQPDPRSTALNLVMSRCKISSFSMYLLNVSHGI